MYNIHVSYICDIKIHTHTIIHIQSYIDIYWHINIMNQVTPHGKNVMVEIEKKDFHFITFREWLFSKNHMVYQIHYRY